jgi:nucleotide-binding universal stress UspA family protein
MPASLYLPQLAVLGRRGNRLMKNWRVLVATDGSEVGEHAVGVARGLSNGGGVDLEVFGVETEGLSEVVGTPQVRRGASPSATNWGRGVPGVEIVRRADLLHVDLVVLGRKLRTPAAPVRLGPTSDAVIRRRQGPSLFVPSSVPGIHRVVIALDGTPRGFGVLDPAVRLLARTHAESRVITVLPDGDPTDNNLEDPRVIRVHQALSRLPGGGARWKPEVRRGDPVAEILRFLTEVRADLLVLGVRRGGPAGDMGSGHVGRDLLQAAAVAILSIPI